MIRRFSLLLGVVLLLGAAEPPAQPIRLSPEQAEKEGRALVAEILLQRPAESSTNTGVLKIRNADGARSEIPVRFEIIPTATNWVNIYETTTPSNNVSLVITHSEGRPNEYVLSRMNAGKVLSRQQLSGSATMIPFAGSDFWLADLGLEFFQWPSQLLVQKVIRKSRSCKVLESVNPNAKPGEYARVVSWIDSESDGILHADAYDVTGRKIKEFDPKDLKKDVNGQWQLLGMEMLNVLTDSRTQIKFDLDSK
jgi:hypothetical protein